MQAHELRRKAAELREKIRKLVELAESENRETNTDEDALIDGWKADAESLDRRAKKIEEVEAAVASPAPTRAAGHHARAGHSRRADDVVAHRRARAERLVISEIITIR